MNSKVLFQKMGEGWFILKKAEELGIPTGTSTQYGEQSSMNTRESTYRGSASVHSQLIAELKQNGLSKKVRGGNPERDSVYLQSILNQIPLIATQHQKCVEIVKTESGPIRNVYKTIHIPNRLGNHDVIRRENVFYDNNVTASERVPGLCAAVSNEIECVYGILGNVFGDKLLQQAFDCGRVYDNAFRKIPVVLSKEMPEKGWNVMRVDMNDLLNLILKNQGNNPGDFKKVILDYINNHTSSITDVIYGMYYPTGGEKYFSQLPKPYYHEGRDGVPYIKIFYRNVDCPDVEKYKAVIFSTLSHELFHFFHDQASPVYNSICDSRDPVIEGTADFFSSYYCIDRYNVESNSDPTMAQARLTVAEDEYLGWKKRFDYCWPYAYALCLYTIKGMLHSLPKLTSDYATLGLLDKLKEVFDASRTNMDLAFQLLLQ